MDSHIIVNVLCIIPIFIGGYLTYKKFQDGLFTYKNFIAFTIYILAGLFFSIKKYDFSPFGLFCEFLIFAFFISIFLLIVSIKNRFQKGIVASLIIMALFFVAVLLTGNKEIPYAESTFESIKFTLIFLKYVFYSNFFLILLNFLNFFTNFTYFFTLIFLIQQFYINFHYKIN